MGEVISREGASRTAPIARTTASTDNTDATRQLVVLISGVFHAAYMHVLPQFEMETGLVVKNELSPSMGDSPQSVESRLRRGESADVLIMAGRGLDEVDAKQMVMEGTRVELARAPAGLAMKKGAPKPNISTPELLRETLLSSSSVGYSISASGQYVSHELFRKLGIEEQMKDKAHEVKGMTPVAYVAVSRASHDARIYTNNADELGKALSDDVSKTSALGRKHQEAYQPTPAERLKDAIETLGKNHTERGVAMLREQGRIHEYADPDHRLAALATDFAKGPARSIVISPDPTERKELTTLIRRELGRGEAPSSLILIEKGGSRLRAESYAPGDLVNYKAGDEKLGIAPNSTAIVREVKAKNNLITVDTAAGEQVSYRLHQAKTLTQQSTVYREEQREFAPNERVRFTAAVPEHSILNRSFGTVSGRSEDGKSLDITLDNGKQVQLTPDQAKHIDYGYAVSSPTRADRVLFNVQDPAQLNKDSQLYSSLSRTRDPVLYTNDVAALTRGPAVKIEPPSREFSFSHGPELAAAEREIVFGIVR